jgi:hypothetical protein
VSFIHMVEFIRVLKLYCMMFHLWVQFHPFEDFVHDISFIKLKKIIQM